MSHEEIRTRVHMPTHDTYNFNACANFTSTYLTYPYLSYFAMNRGANSMHQRGGHTHQAQKATTRLNSVINITEFCGVDGIN